MMQYVVGVGSNRGDRRAWIRRGRQQLEADGLVQVLAESTYRQTAPLGGPPGQGDYCNGAWLLATGLGPHQLLHRLLAAESACGRERAVRDGPRTLDLDLLLAADGRCLAGPTLTLPHPHLHRRTFVLEPLAELVPTWRHPILKRSIAELWTWLNAPENRCASSLRG